MAGFWQNLGTNANFNLLQQALQPNNSNNNYNPTPAAAAAAAMTVLGNDLNTARAILAASIPAATGAFLNNAPTTVTKTVISLPPSLASKRQQIQGEMSTASKDKVTSGVDSNISSQGTPVPTSSKNPRNIDRSRYVLDNVSSGASTVNFLSSSSQSQSLDAFATKSDVRKAEDTSSPVFSAEISRGQEFPAKEEQSQIVIDPATMRGKLLPHGSHRILHDNDHWHKFVVSYFYVIVLITLCVCYSALKQLVSALILPTAYSFSIYF